MSNTHKPTERVLKVLLTLSSDTIGLTLTEISEKTDIPKSTLSAILRTLLEMQFISVNELNQYMIGVNCFKVGENFLKSIDGIEIIRNYMKEIVSECNEICQLGILNRNKVLYIEKIDPLRSIKLVSSVGMHLPAHSTALGKALLSQYDNKYIRNLINDDMEKLTDNTITDLDKLINDIEQARIKGFASEVGESSEGVECIAVPLSNNGITFAAISISIPSFRSSKEKSDKISNLLLKYKEIIEAQIDGIPLNLLPDNNSINKGFN